MVDFKSFFSYRRNVKVSDLEDFVGKDLLIEAQRRGLKILGDKLKTSDALPSTIIGLAQILAEYGVGGNQK